MKRLTIPFVLLLVALFSLGLVSCNPSDETDPPHTHLFDQQNASDGYLKNTATTQSAPEYYYSCVCGEKGSETFFFGDPLPSPLSVTYALSEDGGSYIVTGATGQGTTLEIPAMRDGLRITAIADGAFDGNTTLQSVLLPSTMERIGVGAFRGCTALSSIVLPESVTAIEASAFSGCTGLAEVRILGTVSYLGNAAFYVCTGLESLYFAEGMTCNLLAQNGILWDAGVAGEGITVSYPCTAPLPALLFAPNGQENLPKILSSTARHDYKEEWTVTDTHHYRACRANGCTAVIAQETHRFGDWITDLEATCRAEGEKHRTCTVCEQKTETASIEIKEHALNSEWSADGNYHFRQCQTDGCDYIADWAAHSGGDWTADETNIHGRCATCDREVSRAHGMTFTKSGNGYTVTSYLGLDAVIVIPSIYQGLPVTAVGERAFYGSAEITDLIIGDSVVTIGDYAFSSLPWLARITIGQAVSTIPSTAFYDCPARDGITVAAGNAKYHSSGNCLIETASKTLILGSNTGVIPTDGSVEIIGYGAFEYCYELETIVIPSTVTTIAGSAFRYCSALSEIVIPSSVTSILSRAFSYCTSLTSVVIPDSVTEISNYLFDSCFALRSVTLPKTVTSIGSSAFAGCTALREILYQGLAEEWYAVTLGNRWWTYTAGSHLIIRCADEEVWP